MIKQSLAVVIALASSLLVIGNGHAGNLGADEIKSLFSGMTVDSYNLKKDIEASIYYDTNGQFYGMRDDSIFQGTWAVNGEDICLTFGNGKTRCRVIQKHGDTYYKFKIKGNGNMIRIIEYRKFTKGNPNNYKFVN